MRSHLRVPVFGPPREPPGSRHPSLSEEIMADAGVATARSFTRYDGGLGGPAERSSARLTSSGRRARRQGRSRHLRPRRRPRPRARLPHARGTRQSLWRMPGRLRVSSASPTGRRSLPLQRGTLSEWVTATRTYRRHGRLQSPPLPGGHPAHRRRVARPVIHRDGPPRHTLPRASLLRPRRPAGHPGR